MIVDSPSLRLTNERGRIAEGLVLQSGAVADRRVAPTPGNLHHDDVKRYRPLEIPAVRIEAPSPELLVLRSGMSPRTWTWHEEHQEENRKSETLIKPRPAVATGLTTEAQRSSRRSEKDTQPKGLA